MREIGNERGDLGGRGSLPAHHASYLSNLMNVRPGGVQVGVHLAAHADGPMLDPSTMTIPR